MKTSFLIAVDIGNSSINIGFFSPNSFLVRRIDTYPLQQPEKYRQIIEQSIQKNCIEKTFSGGIISSVVPDLIPILRKALRGFFSRQPMIVNSGMKTGLTFRNSHPEKLGSDRIANVVAAYAQWEAPVAVVDFGTATTISFAGKESDFLGGAILPGIRLMSESLSSGASQLFQVPLEPPESVLGTDTTQCIQSGLFYGTTGAVEKILNETEKCSGFHFHCIVTGGFGKVVSPFLQRQHTYVPHLTLEGLRILYKRNINA